MLKKDLSEFLIQEELITVEQLAEAKAEQKREGSTLISALNRLKTLPEEELAGAIAEVYGLQTVQVSNFTISPEVLSLVPKNICDKNKIIPVTKTLGTLVVAVASPDSMRIEDDLNFVTRSKIEFVVSTESEIERAIAKYYDSASMGSAISELESSQEEEQLESVNLTESTENDEPIIRFVNLVLTEAVRMGASDIHMEPYEKRFRIRMRVDGKLIEKLQPPSGSAAAITNRIKILSKMNISERRRPQDGRIKMRIAGNVEVEFRVNSTPTAYGEKIVMRFLDKSGLNKPMNELGFEDDDLKRYIEAIHLPQGMVLLTGPTGSGKSTTVYSALNALNVPTMNICTAEDPVEMALDGINHVQANAQINMTFSDILRAFLRQDPDVIFVGEIRDLETAEIAFKAASTGHMVISTLHTNDAAATVARLTEIGIPPYIIASTVSLIVAQRLLGRVCTGCAEEVEVEERVLLELGIPQEEIGTFPVMRGKGCGKCNGSGIKGRVAIHETMKITPGVKDAIFKKMTHSELRKVAEDDGMRSLRLNALLKLRRGVTSIDQVMGATVT